MSSLLRSCLIGAAASVNLLTPDFTLSYIGSGEVAVSVEIDSESINLMIDTTLSFSWIGNGFASCSAAEFAVIGASLGNLPPLIPSTQKAASCSVDITFQGLPAKTTTFAVPLSVSFGDLYPVYIQGSLGFALKTAEGSSALQLFTLNYGTTSAVMGTAIDSKQYTGDIIYVPCDSEAALWQMPVASYQVTGATAATTLTGASAIIDTTSPIILVPLTDYDNLIAGIIAQSSDTNSTMLQGVFDCSIVNNLPVITIVVGTDSTIVLAGSNYATTVNTAGTLCALAFFPTSDSHWTLGTAFLQNFYTIFDRTNTKVGFAMPATPTAPVVSFSPAIMASAPMAALLVVVSVLLM